MPLCSDEHCTGNHHGYPDLCPRRKRAEAKRKSDPTVRERDRVYQREKYEALDGFAYSHLLLKHRRVKALIRIDKRRR
jgi:hypothetical protein